MREEKLREKGSADGHTYRWFWCPGCNELHSVNETWGFNGDSKKPTFTPSILVTKPGLDYRCHSFITDGMIQFLGDCTHALAGQTVPLPDLPTGWFDEEQVAHVS